MLAVVMAREEFDRIGRIAQNRKDTLDSDVGKHVIRRHLACDARCRMAPHVQVKLLDSGQTRATWLALSLGARIRFWCGGHRCSSILLLGVGLLRGCAGSRR